MEDCIMRTPEDLLCLDFTIDFTDYLREPMTA